MIHPFYIGNRWLTEYVTYIERGRTLGYARPSYDYRPKINRLIRDFKDCGALALLDVWYVFGHDGDNNFKCINIKTPASFQATPTGGIASNNFGFVGNGSSHYLDTNFNISSSGTNYVILNASRFCWVHTAGADTLDGANSNTYNNMYNTSITIQRVNSADSTVGNIDLSGTGFKMVGRNDNALIRPYNNAFIANEAQATSALPNVNQHILRRVASGVGQFGTSRISVYGMGGYLGASADAMYSALQTYMNSI